MELIIENLSKSYGRKQALMDVNLRFAPGVYGLLGPNGAGKSTLMNILTENLRPDRGQVLLNGEDIRKMGERFRERLGYCPQQQTLYPNFTGEQFLLYMASLQGMDKGRAKEQLEYLLKSLSLYDVRHKEIRSYSGGMKQRLLLAQSMLHDPDILILDEPTAGLDPRQRVAVRNLIGKFALHKIVLISTHVVQDVEFIADQLIFIKNGRILDMGTPEHYQAQLEGLVWEVTVPESEIAEVERLGTVCGIAKNEGGVCVRLLTDKPCGKAVRPMLEDVYLHYFGVGEP